MPGLDNFPFLEVIIDCNAPGDNSIVTAVGNRTIRVFRMFFVVAADVVVTIKNGAGIPLTGPMSMLANGSFVLDVDYLHWFDTSIGNDFIINLSAPVQTSGRAYYTQCAT